MGDPSERADFSSLMFPHRAPARASTYSTQSCGKSPPPPSVWEAHHLSDRGSHFDGVYPHQSPLLGLSRSWQQDTETVLIMLRYPPRKLPTRVPTRAVLRTASYSVEVPVAAKAPGHPPPTSLDKPLACYLFLRRRSRRQ